MPTKIEWAEETWNPIRARNKETGGVGHFCVHVSPGCEHCYAEGFQKRFNNPIRYAAQDAGKVRTVHGQEGAGEALRLAEAANGVRLLDDRSVLRRYAPPVGLRCFRCAMKNAPQHQFQILTKRPDRMSAVIKFGIRAGGTVLPNVWLGVSVEDRAQPRSY